jgi:GNAT superfamily N-acetyltransferase
MDRTKLTYLIRPASPAELSTLRAIEDAAGRLFSGLGLVDEALDVSFPSDELARLIDAGQVWVACGEGGVAVGMIIASVREGAAYIEELDVHPEHGRRGLGARLLARACAWARARGCPAVTLSTFRDLSFNGVFYRKHGFRDLDPKDWSPGMLAIRDAEARHGLAVEARVFMRLELTPARGALSYPRVDQALARRLERAEAATSAAYIESRQRWQPHQHAAWVEVAGAYALFDGAASPLTQTFGLGVFAPVLAADFTRIEAFFTERGARTAHEVSALAAPDVWHQLASRGYTPIESSTVLVRPTEPARLSPSGGISVVRCSEADASVWARVFAQSVADESAEPTANMLELGSVIARAGGNVHCFLAELEGEAVAAGVLSIESGIGLLAGAGTVPRARKQGAQSALLAARSSFAAAQGADLAMVVAGPGSSSQRNAERQGFRAVYTRSKWQLEGAC